MSKKQITNETLETLEGRKNSLQLLLKDYAPNKNTILFHIDYVAIREFIQSRIDIVNADIAINTWDNKTKSGRLKKIKL